MVIYFVQRWKHYRDAQAFPFAAALVKSEGHIMQINKLIRSSVGADYAH
jgi:hypothetical protein